MNIESNRYYKTEDGTVWHTDTVFALKGSEPFVWASKCIEGRVIKGVSQKFNGVHGTREFPDFVLEAKLEDSKSTKCTLDDLKEMINRHDLTYQYSDDGNVYRRGQAERENIYHFAEQFDQDVVVKIWNDMVDKGLSPDYREGWYWKK